MGRRHSHGRRPPGHRRKRDCSSSGEKGVSGGRPIGRRHCRNRRHGARAHEALPDRDRALREDRRHPSEPRRQSQLPCSYGSQQSGACFPGSDCRTPLLRFRRPGAARQALQLRRRWRPLRRAGLCHHGFGGAEARAFLKGVWRGDLRESEAIRLALEALIAAAEEDSATAGPDARRGIYPNVVTVSADGYREIPDDELAPVAAAAMEDRP